MIPLRILVLTDHANHSVQDTLYPWLRSLNRRPEVAAVEVMSRAQPENAGIFQTFRSQTGLAGQVDEYFYPAKRAVYFSKEARLVSIQDYDWVLLRIPKPNPAALFEYLESIVDPAKLLNRPSGIREVGSKAFLQHYPEIAPRMRLCHSLAEVKAQAAQYGDVVIKPLFESGGRGIVRVKAGMIQDGTRSWTWDTYQPSLELMLEEGVMVVEYLQRVGEGDKRILLANGQVLGSSLRLPAPGSWLCNVSQGGSSHSAEIDSDEQAIIDRLLPDMTAKGIMMVGLDTLVNNEGRRVLSEINASCPGGWYPTEITSGQPVVERLTDETLRYMNARGRSVE
jgi:glutathione synthase